MSALAEAVVKHAANQALSELIGKNQEPENTSWMGLKIAHWTVPVFGVSALVGAVVFIGGWFVGDFLKAAAVSGAMNLATPLIALGGVLLAVSSLGAYYITEFKAARDLDQSAEALAHSSSQLKATQEELQAVTENFQKVSSELHLAKGKYSAVHMKWVISQKKFDESVAELSEVNASLKERLVQLQSQVRLFKQAAGKIKADVASFGEKNEELQAYIQDLDQQTDMLEDLSKDFEAHMKKVSKTYENIGKEKDELALEVGELQEELEKIGQEVQHLEGVGEQFGEGVNQVAQYAEKLAQTEEELSVTKKDLEQTHQKLAALEVKMANSVKQLSSVVEQGESQEWEGALFDAVQTLLLLLEDSQAPYHTDQLAQPVADLTQLLKQYLVRKR